MDEKRSREALDAEHLQLLASLDAIADLIAAHAAALDADQAEAYIDRELAKTAVLMRKYEDRGASPASIGYAIDASLRARIAARLKEWRS